MAPQTSSRPRSSGWTHQTSSRTPRHPGQLPATRGGRVHPLVRALAAFTAIGAFIATTATTASADHGNRSRLSARLTLQTSSSAPLTVQADGSGSTSSRSAITTFRFDFGDGSPAVTTSPPTRSASHTYAGPGSFTVRLTVTDGSGNTSNTSRSITLSGPPVDQPPVARLTVRAASTDTFDALADGSATTDGDATPVARYQFDFGDGSPAVTTFPPTASASHTYPAAGTYTVTLVATDTRDSASAPTSARVTVPRPPGPKIQVYAGYYDTHHPGNTQPKPDPWQGSPNVTFVGKPDGSSGGWDASCVRIDNAGDALPDVLVTVDIGTRHFALWGSRAIPAGGTLIVTQTALENFDGSDTNEAGCFGCSASLCSQKVSRTVPVVHVRINGVTTDYFDTGQILNTHGVDAAGCPATGTRNDESHAWVEIGTEVPAAFRAASGGPGEPDVLAPERPGLWMDPPRPNPSAGDLAVRFGLAHEGAVRLGIYDVAGRLIQQVLDTTMPVGNYDARVALWDAPRGMLYYKLSTPDGTLTRSFVLVR
jgi:PKD repeat protein